MQALKKNIKNENGVTMTVLVITIIILLIILGISISYGTRSIKETIDDRTRSEIELVQQAVANQYMLLMSKNEDGIIPTSQISEDIDIDLDDERPSELIGKRISSSSKLKEKTYGGFTNVTPQVEYSDNEENLTFEQYYYYLKEDDLAKLKIVKNSDDEEDREYVVNYSTGEVFDVKYKIYRTSDEPVYKSGANTKIEQEEYDFEDTNNN